MTWYRKIADQPDYDVYHGTPNQESILSKGFVYDYLGEREDQYGPGFYFTTHYEYANTFTEPKSRDKAPSFGLGTPGVIQAKVTLKKPINLDPMENAREQFPIINKQIVRSLIMDAEKTFGDEIYSNWGDIKYYGKPKIIQEMVEAMVNGPSLTTLYDLFGNDISKGLRSFSRLTGYDGVLVKLNHGNRLVNGTIVNLPNGGEIVVAWFPEQIKIVSQGK